MSTSGICNNPVHKCQQDRTDSMDFDLAWIFHIFIFSAYFTVPLRKSNSYDYFIMAL